METVTLVEPLQQLYSRLVWVGYGLAGIALIVLVVLYFQARAHEERWS